VSTGPAGRAPGRRWAATPPTASRSVSMAQETCCQPAGFARTSRRGRLRWALPSPLLRLDAEARRSKQLRGQRSASARPADRRATVQHHRRSEAMTTGRGAAWSAHLLWEQPEECAVRSGVCAGSARPFPAESGGVSRPGWLIRQPRIRSKTRPVRLVMLWSITAGRGGFGVQLVGPKRRLFNDRIAIPAIPGVPRSAPDGRYGLPPRPIPDVVPSLSRSDDPTMRDFNLRLPGQDLDLSSPGRPNQHQAQV